MKSGTYKLSERDKMNLMSIKQILHNLLPTPREAQESSEEDGFYTKTFELGDPFNTSFVMCYVCKANRDCKQTIEAELLKFNKYNKLRTQLKQLQDAKYE